MKEVEKEVKTKDAGPWVAKLFLVESLDEAKEVYGDEGGTFLLNSGLAVKQQNIERDIFSSAKPDADMAGAVRLEAEEKAKAYRPGSTAKQSNKAKAYALLKVKMSEIIANKELDDKISDALMHNNFKEIIILLEGAGSVVEEETVE